MHAYYISYTSFLVERKHHYTHRQNKHSKGCTEGVAAVPELAHKAGWAL
jgi:hypothetical protein